MMRSTSTAQLMLVVSACVSACVHDWSVEHRSDAGPDAGSDAAAEEAGPSDGAAVDSESGDSDSGCHDGADACEPSLDCPASVESASKCPSGVGKYCGSEGEYTCALDADGCLVAGPSSSCTANNECMEAICTNEVGCGSQNRTGGARCATGVCDGAGSCVACLLDSDCREG